MSKEASKDIRRSWLCTLALLLLPPIILFAQDTPFRQVIRVGTDSAVVVGRVHVAVDSVIPSVQLVTVHDTVRITTSLLVHDTITVFIGTPGVAFGPWHLPPTSYATTTYTGAYLGYSTIVSAGTPAGFLDQIRVAKSAGRRLMVNLVGRKASSTGGPDMPYYLAGVAAMQPYAAALQAYADSGTILGVVIADEPNCGGCWGGKPWTVAQMQQAAAAIQALVPTIARGFRVDPSFLASLNAPNLVTLLDFAWLQYEGPLHTPCARQLSDCITSASTAATGLGLKLVMGVNTLDGGDGSSGVPGTFTNAASVNRWQLSAAEVLKYGLALVTDPRVCAVLSWRYGANATKPQINSGMTDTQLASILSFDTRVKPQMDSVARTAARQPARSCRR
jgi:hypothetical protein